MDGPNVNLKFQQDLAKYFDEKRVSFLNIDTCLLHKVHRSFKHRVKSLPIDQFTVDLHGFFKFLSTRREDYKEMEDVTDFAAHYALRHSSVCWLTLKFVLVRIIEQWENLRAYFLEFLPKQKIFKREIKTTHRYVNIKEVLEDPLSLAYLAFVILIANEYESFLLSFQSQEPMIHLLYPGISRLLTNMLKNFVSKRVLYREDGVTMKPATQLKLIKLNKESKSLNLIKLVLKPSSSNLLLFCISQKLFEVLHFYSNPASDEITLNKVIFHAQYLHPKKRKEVHSTSAISNLSFKIVSTLGNEAKKSWLQL